MFPTQVGLDALPCALILLVLTPLLTHTHTDWQQVERTLVLESAHMDAVKERLIRRCLPIRNMSNDDEEDAFTSTPSPDFFPPLPRDSNDDEESKTDSGLAVGATDQIHLAANGRYQIHLAANGRYQIHLAANGRYHLPSLSSLTLCTPDHTQPSPTAAVVAASSKGSPVRSSSKTLHVST